MEYDPRVDAVLTALYRLERAWRAEGEATTWWARWRAARRIEAMRRHYRRRQNELAWAKLLDSDVWKQARKLRL